MIYLIFFEESLKFFSHKAVTFFLLSLTMILCMTFPIKIELGFIFDLRYIPFLIAALYGGYPIAFPLYIVLNVYRFIIGGDGVIYSLLFSTIVFLLVPLLNKTFIKQNEKKRIIIAGILSFLTMAFYLFTLSSFFEALNKEFWLITINVLVINVIGMLIIITLIEKIIMNAKKREKLIDAERLSVISELSASVSHEIRNPLTVASGFLQLLVKSTNLSQEEKRYLNFSLSELGRAEKIVSDFLSFAKPQASNMVDSNLKDELEYVNNIMVPYANIHQVDLQCSFKNELITHYDRNQVQQCLINLYKNGIESMVEKGGTLAIDVSSEGKEIIIKIKDDGIGMSKEDVLRLGKPYYSTKKDGTGLGMLMVYSTIHKLGGHIKVTSEIGKGTAFSITLPVKDK